MVDIKSLLIEARALVAKEVSDKAKTALVSKMRQLESAKAVVRNIERDIADLTASISDGSFV